MKNRIAEIIEKEKLTSSRFANLIGIQPSAISHILSGRNNPSMEVIQKILNTFRTINSDWLILGVGAMYRETGETSKKQSVEIKITPNKPQMPSLFSDEPGNDTEYRKENELTTTSVIQNSAPSQNQFASATSESFPARAVTADNKNQENNKQSGAAETKVTLPKRIVKKIIIYYSDNTFEEYNMLLNKEE